MVAYAKDGTRIDFSFSGDQLETLTICSKMGLSLETSSAVKVGVDKESLVGLPMRYADLLKLFGEPSEARRDFLVAQWPC